MAVPTFVTQYLFGSQGHVSRIYMHFMYITSAHSAARARPGGEEETPRRRRPRQQWEQGRKEAEEGQGEGKGQRQGQVELIIHA